MDDDPKGHGKATEDIAECTDEGCEALIDSGCSRHACGKLFKNWLTNWKKGPTVTVRVADGTKYTSSDYASLLVEINTENGWKRINISNVLYIEELSKLLLSVGAMAAKGVEFNFVKGLMTMTIKDSTVTVTRAPGKNLYKL